MSHRRQRFRLKFPKQIRAPQLLGLLIVFQLVTLLLLVFAWPSPVTLTFVTPFEEIEYWQPLVESFEAKHPGIRIKLSDDSQANYTTDNVEALYSSELKYPTPRYDLVYMDIIWVPWFAESEWLKDLSEYVSLEELFDQFVESEVEAGRYENGLYRIPFRSDIGVMFYNEELLEKAGYQLPTDLPKTLMELRNISNDLQNKGIATWGYLWQGQQYEGLVANFVEVLRSFGGFWIDLDQANDDPGKVGLDQEAAIQAADFLRAIVTRETSPADVKTFDEEKSLEIFAQNETVFLRGWSYFWKRANLDGAPLQGNFEMAPTSIYGEPGCRGGWGFGMAQNTKHPKEAWEAIQYFTSASAQRQFVLDSGYLPSRQALFEDAQILERYPHFSQLRQKLENNSLFRPQVPYYPRASDILQDHLWAVLAGLQTPKDAMEEAADDTRKLLSSLADNIEGRK